MVNIFSAVRKIAILAAKIVLGIFLFYLFLAYVVIPVGAPWAVRSQGTKLLKHTVQVRSIFFNPFLLRLNVKGFAIMDSDKQVMAGFDKFWADISFISLLRKEIQVESFGLDGLQINAALLADGNINLLELAASLQSDTEKKSQAEKPAAAQLPSADSLPPVTVDSLALKLGSISFVDKSVEPNFKTVLSNIEIRVSGISTRPDAQIKVFFNCALDEKGSIAAEALLMPFVNPLKLDAVFSLNNYALQVLTPYVGKYTGRAVKDGKLDMKMSYTIADNQFKASHKILVQQFDFGDKVVSKDALNMPFGLAVGLLEDPQGRINISLPVTGDMSDPKFEYFHLIGQVARNFFMKIVTKPLMFLLSLAGSESGTEEMGYVRFAPGKADLSDDNKERLRILLKGLKERPRLLLEINGSYDIKADWQAMRKETFETRYQAMRKESTRPDSALYSQLYIEFFGLRSYGDLTRDLKSSSGKLDQEKIDAEIKRRLIEDAPVDKGALDILAEARGRVVYDFFITEGFDKARVSIGTNREAQSSMGYVPMEFTLTVFETQ
ncbi:MAG: DUF748 domain-containing protein [Candidatus Omnitrophota bacterium]|jgi:hypothetical protein